MIRLLVGDNTIKIWKLGSGNYSALSLDIRIELFAALSPDGQLISSVDKTINLEFEQWKTASHPSGHSDWVNSVAISRWTNTCQWW